MAPESVSEAIFRAKGRNGGWHHSCLTPHPHYQAAAAAQKHEHAGSSDLSWQERYIKTGALTSDAAKPAAGDKASESLASSRKMLDCYYTHTVDYCDKQAASSVAGQKSHVKAASLQPYDMDCFYHHTVAFCEALKNKNKDTEVLKVEPSHKAAVAPLPPVHREPRAAAPAVAAAPRPVAVPALSEAHAVPNPDASAASSATSAPITWAKHAEEEEEQQQRSSAAAKAAVHAAAASKVASTVHGAILPTPVMTSAQRDRNALDLAEGLGEGGGGGGGASMGSAAISLARKEAAQREDVSVGPRAAIPAKRLYAKSISAESAWDISHGVRVIDGSPHVKASRSENGGAAGGVSVAGLKRLARMDGLAVIPDALEVEKGRGHEKEGYAGRNAVGLKAAADAEKAWEARRKAAVEAYYQGEKSALSAGREDTASWEVEHGLRSKGSSPVVGEGAQEGGDAPVAAAAAVVEGAQQEQQQEEAQAVGGRGAADGGMMVAAKTGGVQSLSGQGGGGAGGGYSAMLKAHAAAEAKWEADHGLRRSSSGGRGEVDAPAYDVSAQVVPAAAPQNVVDGHAERSGGGHSGGANDEAASKPAAAAAEGVKEADSGGVSKSLVEGAVKEEEGLGAAGVAALGFSSPAKFEKHLEKEGI